MLFVLSFISILCFLLWVNIVITDFINARLNPYAMKNTVEEEKFQRKKATFKIVLLVIISLTISAVLFLL